MNTSRPLDLVLLGATGFTGRQAVRAVLRQRPDARWAVAGRDAARLQRVVDAFAEPGARAPQVIVADATDPPSLRAMAQQAKVVLNLAGPYHATGDAVVAACIDAGAHYFDLTGETFWIRRLVEQQHDAAVRAGVKIMPCAGYEALPFDLATLWAAHRLRAHGGGPCREVRIVVSFTGRRPTDPRDAVSGGTAATITELLAHDRSDCLRNMACLLPPGTPDARAVARRNALHWLPEVDDEWQGLRLEHAAGRQPEEHVGTGDDLGQRAQPGRLRELRLVVVHQFGAALVDHAREVGDPDVLALDPQLQQQVQAGERGRTGTAGHQLDLADRLADDLQRVQHRRADDDRGAVLVVVEHGNLQPFAQPALDEEAFRRLDVLEVDAAEGRLQRGDDLDQLVGVGLVDLDIEDVDAGELLEQHRLAFHHRLGRERADVAEAEHRGAVGDHRDEVGARRQ